MSERILIRGGWVLTLGARTSNHAEADVLIEGDTITEVGPRLRARDAEVIDASTAIVMPGFVDTHRHAWMSLFRNLGDGTGFDTLAPHHTPDDAYAATCIGLYGAIEAGITTVVDWSDIQLDESYTEAVLQAHADAGIRTVFVHATPPWAETAREAALAALASRPSPSPMTTFAVGPSDPDPADLDGSTTEWALARDHGWRIHAHCGRRASDTGVATALAAGGRLGADVTLIHCSRLDDADLDAIAGSGAEVAITPSAEMTGGLGAPPMQRMIDRSIRPGLGIDDERIGPGDVFAQMRAAISIQHGHHFDLKLAGKGGLPNLLTTREVIRYATSDGARVAGLGSATGSLEPGRQADVLVLHTDRPNIHPINDPIGAVVWGMDTSNVSSVIAGGRVLVRDGELQTDTAAIRQRALEARRRVTEAAGIAPVGAGGGGR
ncbi:MAG TPA: amidohydrolase family protein [Acidimicrobiia bacterium]|nr:amidohydrolase family protein [Acidimicrobiia bacterium]